VIWISAYIAIGLTLGAIAVAAVRILEKHAPDKADTTSVATLARFGTPMVVALMALIWPYAVWFAVRGRR
jgi:hypothetical protein